MLNRILFKQIDNSSLIVFRIIFGFLCLLESVGAIFTGWIRRTLIEPDFTFSFIGFEWLQPLPGNGMYFYYALMGMFGLFIMLGYKYRFSAIAFALMWSATYFMQKSSYNNHYYLLILLSGFMILLPANRYLSIDAKQNPQIESIAMPQWCKLIFILQMFIVYTYAAVAKLYPDWLDLSVMERLMKSKEHYDYIGEWLQKRWIHYILAYGGILFDALIIPLLLNKPTRKWAFIVSIGFHMFNSIVFQIGIFPYLSMAMALFFFNPKTIRNIFLKHKEFYSRNEILVPSYKKPFVILFSVYFLIQLVLPLRHHFIQDNVLWTEEGHRLSWRMMLRTRSGITTYKVVDKDTGKSLNINMQDYLTKKQIRTASAKPDAMWQFAQRLKKEYKANGQDVSVYINSRLSINGKPFKTFIDPNVDIANVEWQALEHSDWILPSKQD